MMHIPHLKTIDIYKCMEIVAIACSQKKNPLNKRAIKFFKGAIVKHGQP
jgi:hypothetical protein